MTILRIATSEADFTTMGGDASTNTNFFDPDRVDNCFELDSNENASLVFPTPVGNETWFHFVWGQDGNNGFHETTIFDVKDSSNNVLASIRQDGLATYFRIHGDTFFEGSPTNVSINGTVVFDVQVIVNGNSDITVRGYINSALQFDSIQSNSANKGKPADCNFQNNYSGSFSHSKFLSEVIVADEDTRGFRLREFKPQSFGVFQQWDGTVSAVVDASLATGVSTDVADERVSFGVSNLDQVQGGDIINRIVAQSYAQRGTSGLTGINHFFRYDDGTVQDGADITLGLFGEWYVDEYLNNPRTGAPWAPAELAGIQLGIRART